VLATDDVVSENRELTNSFIETLRFADDPGHPDRSAMQRHQIAEKVSLRDALEMLLIPMRTAGTTDSQRHTGLLLQLSQALDEDPNELCTVYVMSPGASRERAIDDGGQMTSYLFQGAAPVDPPERRGKVYPGDLQIRGRDGVTVQLHRLNLTLRDEIVARDIPVPAVWVPARLALPWLVQDQAGRI
jgi:hypothetical protein